MDRAPITEIMPPRRPMWQTAGMWFVGGLALAWLAAYFFDRRRGAARRQMAIDRTLAQARDVSEWTGMKARHVRNKAEGILAEREGGAAT